MKDNPTSPTSNRMRWLEVAFWIALPLIGLAFFLFNNTHESLYIDETYSMGISKLNPLEIWRAAAQDVHPPLYYLILWAFRSLAGPSPWVARSVSALGAFGLLMIGAFPLRRLLGSKAAILFMLMTASAPTVLAYAQDIRMYTWAAFFVTGMAAYLFLAIRDGRRGDWILTFLFTVAAMYTHIFSLMAAAFLGLFGLVYVLVWARARWRPYLITFGIAGVLFLPWLSILLEQVRAVSKDFWIPPVTWWTIQQSFDFPYGLKFYDTFGSIWIASAVAVMLLVGLVYALRRRQEAAPAIIFLLSYLAVFAAAVGFSLAVKPILVNRYMLPVTGLWMAAAAYALSQFRREIVVTAMIILFLANASTLVSVYQDRYNGPMQEVADFMTAQLQPGDIILHTDEHTAGTFAYYLPNNAQLLFQPPGSNIHMDGAVFPNVEMVTDLESVIARGKRIWLATRRYSGNPDAYGIAANRLGLTQVPESVFDENPDLTEYGSVRYFQLPLSWYSVYIDHTP